MTNLHKRIDSPILYLDYDGVLHPDAVFRVRGKIVLRAEGVGLFGWAPLLAECLGSFPEVRIILSTSWVRVLSYDTARAWLPYELQKRVIGATWHSSVNKYWWLGLTRYQQIRLHAERHQISRWIAIDDDAVGWPTNSHSYLVHTDPLLGIAAADARAQLLRKLGALAK